MRLPRPRRAATTRLAASSCFALLAASCGGGSGGGGNAGTSPATDLASVLPTPQLASQNSGAGAFAADYLRRTNFTELVVEVDYPSDRPPSPGAIALLEQRLSERCDKPDGVTVVLSDAIPVGAFPPVLGTNDLDELEAVYRGTFSDLPSHTAAMYVLYVHGDSDAGDGSGNTEVLGLAYHGGSFAIFVDAADHDPLDLLVTPAEIEATGLVHEAGHCMGLTGATIPMLVDHRDEAHGFHDVDPTSVMYWVVTVNTFGPSLGDPTFAAFDQNSKDDIAAYGGSSASAAHVGTQHADGLRSDAEAWDAVVVGYCPHCAGRDCAVAR